MRMGLRGGLVGVGNSRKRNRRQFRYGLSCLEKVLQSEFCAHYQLPVRIDTIMR